MSRPDVNDIAQRVDFIRRLALALVEDAERYGVVVTIELMPLEPLAMGRHEMVVSAREKRT